MKTVKSRLFKKYFKRKYRGQYFACLLVGYILMKKIIGKCNSVGAEAHKVAKLVSFWPNFGPNFTDIWTA